MRRCTQGNRPVGKADTARTKCNAEERRREVFREGLSKNRFERLTEGRCTHWVLGRNRRHAERCCYSGVCTVKENHPRMAKSCLPAEAGSCYPPRGEGARRRRACAPPSPIPRGQLQGTRYCVSPQAVGQLSLLHFALVNGCHTPA